MEENLVNIIFNNSFKSIILSVNKETTIQELINLYFERMGKGNLVDENIEKTYFLCNCKSIDYKGNKETVGSFFEKHIQIIINVCRLEYNKKFRDYTKTRTIKDNIYTCVDEAKVNGQLVAVKKIKKERIKEDIKEDLCTTIVTKEDFKPHVDNFNKELLYMELCHCENTVKIYDYYDTEK